MDFSELLGTLLGIAWLLPLAGFAIEVFGGYWQQSRQSKTAAYLAVGCIAAGFVFSTIAFVQWGEHTKWAAFPQTEHGVGTVVGSTEEQTGNDSHGDEIETTFSGTFYRLAFFGDEKIGFLNLSIDYYIDSLTLVMFMMVTFISTCIHIFALGYMSDELTDDYVDHQVHTSDGQHLHRPGRYYRFFSYMSLFCFSMLGLVIAGNIFMVFIFWELVGICSYLLIGFYVERKSACTAANKAFIVNRVGDFGFLIGLMILWTYFGTFSFSDWETPENENGVTQTSPGLFTMLSRVDAEPSDGHQHTDAHNDESTPADEEHDTNAHHGPKRLDVDEANTVVYLHDLDGSRIVDEPGKKATIPYWLLVAAGLGIFAGCIGKSAQFPLQTWLPDAMEGPTPVSALVHSATMVAAGVYLAGRFYPVFAPEVLLTIAYVGCITLFLAATIAVVATDIKRVLAYSTISQLGYMMLAIGLGGWVAGLFHLITHAFFKSLMFLASGSVIIGCHHEQEMPRMGGLRKKMPITALTMLVGVIAISGLAIPGVIAFSGYHSKDAIVATALAYINLNPTHFLLFLVPLVTAGITAFYMFRLWFYTFAGEPRDKELHDHAHESPLVMTGPLIVLALFAAFVAVGGVDGILYKMLIHSEPEFVAGGVTSAVVTAVALPSHHQIHTVHGEAGMFALIAAILGTVTAMFLYGTKSSIPGDVKRQFSGLHHFLVEKWHFDTLYDVMFVQPVHVVASWVTAIDRCVFDGILHTASRWTVDVSRWDRKFDENVVDRFVNLLGEVTFTVGRSLRVVQTGKLRQYVMFIAIGVVALFMLLFAMLP